MPIQISFGDTKLAARLLHNPTARDLAAQLPLTLTGDKEAIKRLPDASPVTIGLAG